MTKYHLSKSGSPGVCRAEHSCPLGGSNDHAEFSKREDAVAWAEKKLAEEYGGFLGRKSLEKSEKVYDLVAANPNGYGSVEVYRAIRDAKITAQRWDKARRSVLALSKMPANLKTKLSEVFKSGSQHEKSPSKKQRENSAIIAVMNANNAFASAVRAEAKSAAVYTNANGYTMNLGKEASRLMNDYDKINSELRNLRSVVAKDTAIPAEEKEEVYNGLKETLEEEVAEASSTLKANHGLDAEKLSSQKLEKIGTQEKKAIAEARREIKRLTEVYNATTKAYSGTDTRTPRNRSMSGVLSESLRNERERDDAYAELSDKTAKYNETYFGKFDGVKEIRPGGLSYFEPDSI